MWKKKKKKKKDVDLDKIDGRVVEGMQLGSSEGDEMPEQDYSTEGNINSSEEHATRGPDEGTVVLLDESDAIPEPYVGMEFESEDAARNFYYDYATRKGFVVRVMQRRCSEIDGRTLARRLGCNKQGFSPNSSKVTTVGPDKKQKPSVREGCKATFLVKMDKSGRWVVTRFVKEHNHPMVAIAQGFSMEGDKDRKIRELTMALQRQTQLCAVYREKLLKFLASVEDQAEQLSSRVQEVVENVRKVEAEVKRPKIFHR